MEQRGARNRRAEGAAFGGRHVNFLHLKYFLMVAEELNITRAAERLYICLLYTSDAADEL